MKIAIPTSDEINISKDLTSAKGYLVFTVQFGEIGDEEWRPLLINHFPGNDGLSLSTIDDCQVLIIHGKNKETVAEPGWKMKEVLLTEESNITKIVMNYLNTSLYKESNTLCCP